MQTRLITATAALVALAAAAQAQPCLPPTPVPDFDNAVIRTTDLGNRIYMLEGVSGTVGGNVTVAVGDDGVIMVDNMFAQMYGKIKAAIAAITPQPVRYLVNTHFHRDHTGGNEAFAKDGAVIVAHENLKRVLASGSRNGLNCATTPPAPDIALPKETYKDTMTLRLKGRSAELRHPADVHTDGIVSADIVGSFRELVSFIQDDNPLTRVANSSGGSLNLRAEPLAEKPMMLVIRQTIVYTRNRAEPTGGVIEEVHGTAHRRKTLR